MCKLYYQANCYWCTTPIYTDNINNVDFFWNQSYRGFPICNDCSRGLKTDGQNKEAHNKLRKEFGLPPLIDGNEIQIIKDKNTLERWL